MNFHIDDTIVHWTFGPGKIVDIEEKTLEDKTCLYYVVEAGDTTLWIPVSETGERSLRTPISAAEFKQLLKILQSPGEELPDQAYVRQSELNQRLRRKSLEEVCLVIRDLIYRSQLEKLNRSDQETLKRAEGLLLDEWELTLGTPRPNAQHELEAILAQS